MIIGGGKFVLIREIGRGGMGAVFEAENSSIGRRVAIKVLDPRHAGRPEQIQRFRREARAAARIAHPNIVVVHDVNERSNGSIFIVQELLVGKNLREHLDHRRKLTVSETLDILVPIMHALVVVHGQNIVHRDIKPENIFLSGPPDGTLVPKLIDFGIAKMDTGGFKTMPGILLGTPHYMAPEHVLDETIDARADVWAVGTVMFEMLSGRTPFDGPSSRDVLSGVAFLQVPRIESLVSDIPRELADVVHRALDRDLERRYRSMRDFLGAIVAFAEGREPSFASRPTVEPLRPSLKTTLSSLASVVFEDSPSDHGGGQETIEVDEDDTPEPLVPPSNGVALGAIWRRDVELDCVSDRTPGLEECMREAREALRLNALNEAIARAEKAISTYRISGETLGEMRLVQAIAHRWLGDFADAERRAHEAMQHLKPRSARWYMAVGHLVTASGYLGRNDRAETLAQELLAFKVSASKGPHAATACQISIVLIRAGSLALAGQLFRHAHTLTKKMPADPEAQAWLDLASAEFSLHRGEPPLFLRQLESAIKHFAAIGDARNACLQRANIGNAYIQFGAYAQARDVLREAIAVGEPMKLMFIAPLRANLGFVLARLGDLQQALDIETAALEECIRLGYTRSEAFSRIYLTEILLLRGELPAAEAQIKNAIQASSGAPAARAHALAILAEILLERGAVQDAFAPANEAINLLEFLDGAEEGEARIRLSYVRALEATDRLRSASAALAGAQQRLRQRMEQITDPELRKSFEENVPEHKRTLGYELRKMRSNPAPPLR
jgi:eukaryotic-like serine/threonine-protein kinase